MEKQPVFLSHISTTEDWEAASKAERRKGGSGGGGKGTENPSKHIPEII